MIAQLYSEGSDSMLMTNLLSNIDLQSTQTRKALKQTESREPPKTEYCIIYYPRLLFTIS